MESETSRFMGLKVTVYYNHLQGTNDTGTITDVVEGWIELTRANGTVLLIPPSSIRILRVDGQPETEDRLLLRAPRDQ